MRKILLALALLVCFGQLASAQWSVVNEKQVNSGGAAFYFPAFTNSLTYGSTVGVALRSYPGDFPITVTDDAGNTYGDSGAGTKTLHTSGYEIQVFLAQNSSTTSGNRVHIAQSSTSNIQGIAFEVTGGLTSSIVDVFSSANEATASGNGANVFSIPSVATGSNGEFIFAAFCSWTGSNLSTGTSPNSFTSIGTQSNILTEYFVQTTAGAISPTAGTTFNNDKYAGIMVGLKPASSAPYPMVSLSPTSLTFTAQSIGTTSAAQTSILTNTGGVSLTISSITITGTNSGDYAQTNNCPGSLGAGTSCTISVTFTPTSVGTRTASVSIADNAGGSPHTVSLSGLGSGSLAFPMSTLLPIGFICGAPPCDSNNTKYTITLTATGGTPPYTWSGSPIPAGLSLLNPTFTVTSVGASAYGGTAVYQGTFTGGASDAFVGLQFTVSGFTHAVNNGTFMTVYSTVTTLTLANNAYVAETHAATASGGFILGQPTTAGTVAPVITVQDSASSSISKTFNLTIFDQPVDKYGGLTNRPCLSGGVPIGAGPVGADGKHHFYTDKMNGRWFLCTPLGNAFFMNAVADVTPDSGVDWQGVDSGIVSSQKYGTYSLAWGSQTNRRLLSWGFNALGEYNSGYIIPCYSSTQSLSVKLPYFIYSRPSTYSIGKKIGAMTDYVKDLGYGVTATYGTPAYVLDYFDPNFYAYLAGDLNDMAVGSVGLEWSGYNNDYAIGDMIDENDVMSGFKPGNNYNYNRDGAAAYKYNDLHIGIIVLVTAPTQTSSKSGLTYSDTQVKTKAEFSTWLSTLYSGNIATLNAAWSSYYSTFGASGAGWGHGTGILDEDGTCPSKGAHACWVPQRTYDLTYCPPQPGGICPSGLQTDLNSFLQHHAEHLFQTERSTIDAILGAGVGGTSPFLYFGPETIGGWGTPPKQQILVAASEYIDVIGLSGLPPNCSPQCADAQDRVNFADQYGGDKPWVHWEGFIANPDSAMSHFSNPSEVIEFPVPPVPPGTCSSLGCQGDRGAFYQNSMLPGIFNAKGTTNNDYHTVGFKLWDWMDMRRENANWGIVDRRDNAYDGYQATPNAGFDGWGYPTGCTLSYGCDSLSTGPGNTGQVYGDSIDAMKSANLLALDQYGQTSPALASLDKTSFVFSGLQVGAAVPQTVTVTLNNVAATTALNFDATIPVAVSGPDFTISGTCSGALAAMSSCYETITFTPIMKGTRTGTLTFTDDSGGTPGTTQVVALSGTAGAQVMTGGKIS